MTRTLLDVFANDPGPPEERAAFQRWIGVTTVARTKTGDHHLIYGYEYAEAARRRLRAKGPHAEHRAMVAQLAGRWTEGEMSASPWWLDLYARVRVVRGKRT